MKVIKNSKRYMVTAHQPILPLITKAKNSFKMIRNLSGIFVPLSL